MAKVMREIRTGEMNHVEAMVAVRRALDRALSAKGAEALLYHLRQQKGLSAGDAVDRPVAFAEGLSSIFGELGASLLSKRIEASL